MLEKYMEKAKDVKRERLVNELLACKEEGLRVFINKPCEHNPYYESYGLISDGVNIIYVQYGEYGSQLFDPSFQYVPTHCGGGCKILDPGYGYEHLNKEIFEKCVRKGKRLAKCYKAILYDNLDHYFRKDRFAKSTYVEL